MDMIMEPNTKLVVVAILIAKTEALGASHVFILLDFVNPLRLCWIGLCSWLAVEQLGETFDSMCEV
jgi:hypothetical protein